MYTRKAYFCALRLLRDVFQSKLRWQLASCNRLRQDLPSVSAELDRNIPKSKSGKDKLLSRAFPFFVAHFFRLFVFIVILPARSTSTNNHAPHITVCGNGRGPQHETSCTFLPFISSFPTPIFLLFCCTFK